MSLISLCVDYPHSYGTHVPLLATGLAFMLSSSKMNALISEIDGTPCPLPLPVVEFGAGHHSTSLISAFAQELKTEHIVVETDREWLYKTTSPTVLSRATVHLTEASWKAVELLPKRIGLVLIDCESEGFGRAAVLRRMKELGVTAEVVVVHDTEPRNAHLYALEEHLAAYRYRRDDRSRTPHTTMLSNIHDITEGSNG
ncbi:MAG: hypothetical protein IPM61_16810 [Chlorobi bacterium]|nr:hypothetical protein [Chlorobiota bacterium]